MARKRPAASGGKPPPMCKAILLCDAVIADQFTGKGSIIGIFDRLLVSEFPGSTTPFSCFVLLTNGIGRYRITVQVRCVANGENIAHAEIVEIEFPERTTKAVLVIPVPPLVLQAAGEYDFIVLADGQEIDHQTFAATLREDPTDGTGRPNPTDEPREP